MSTFSGILSSLKPGIGSGASTIGTTVFVPFFTFLAALGHEGFYFFMFIMPHTMNMNTIACTTRPNVVGHPLGDAIRDPRIPLTNRKVIGLATTKNVSAEMIEMINFSSCFLPLHPHPQSLKRPMFYYDICQQKNLLKVEPPKIDITNQQCRSLFNKSPNFPPLPWASRTSVRTKMAVKLST